MGRASSHDQLMTAEPRVRLALPSAEQGFSVTERDGLFLIVPRKDSKRRGNDWTHEERKYRSVILDREGRVVSTGYEKFFNAGENEEDTDSLEQALENNEEVWLTEKMDGSLAIRSVIDGAVVFRTRGTWDGNEYGVAMKKVAAKKYPKLLDPEFEPDRSLLFEFVSPDFRIVLRYPEDDLIFLGAVSHLTLEMTNRRSAVALAEEAGLQIVEAHPLPTNLTELVEETVALEGREGVVAACNDGQTLVKIKSAYFLARHRLKSHLNARVIREVCMREGIRDMAGFEKWVIGEEGDWEIVQDAIPLIDRYLLARSDAEAAYTRIKEVVEAKKAEVGEDRKAFALWVQDYFSEAYEKGTAFSIYSGKTSDDNYASRALDMGDRRSDPQAALLWEMCEQRFAAVDEEELDLDDE